MPAVVERLRFLTTVHESEQLQRLDEHYNLVTKLETLKTAIEDNLFGQISFTFTPGKSRMLPQGFDLFLYQQERDISLSPTGSSSLIPSTQTPICAIAQGFCTAAPLSMTPTPFFGAMTQSLATSSSSEIPTMPVPIYRLLRDVRTILDLWKEWTIGLGSLPPIDELNRLHGSYWRTGNKIQYYSTQKRIVDEIKRCAGNFATTENYETVVKRMEEERTYSKVLLDKVSKALRAAKV